MQFKIYITFNSYLIFGTQKFQYFHHFQNILRNNSNNLCPHASAALETARPTLISDNWELVAVRGCVTTV
jgi:hypothetical protein